MTAAHSPCRAKWLRRSGGMLQRSDAMPFGRANPPCRARSLIVSSHVRHFLAIAEIEENTFASLRTKLTGTSGRRIFTFPRTRGFCFPPFIAASARETAWGVVQPVLAPYFSRSWVSEYLFASSSSRWENPLHLKFLSYAAQ